MIRAASTDPVLLTDEQMREFIVNGYVVFTPSVPNSVHTVINRRLGEILEHEPNPGNNVLPRVPEMRHILNSPEVRGALISVLGEDYIEHPHRYCHSIRADSEAVDDPAERLARNCHQDGYTPLGRPRQHYVRFARIMYYPQDSPVALGPTHVIPGTQYNKGLTDQDRARAIPVAGKAGTVSLTHFDIGHAAGVKQLDGWRHMIKFLYVRASEPAAPTWNCKDKAWQKPADITAPYDLDLAWGHIWDWLCGRQDRYTSLKAQGQTEARALAGLLEAVGKDQPLEQRLEAMHALAAMGENAAAAVPVLVDSLGNDHQAARVAATYALGAIGVPAIEALAANLEAAGRREAVDEVPKSWNENAIQMEDAAHALAAIGPPALPALNNALHDINEWSRINAAYALGEMDAHALAAVPALLACLDEPSHRIVRTAVDALASIGSGVPAAALGALLQAQRPGWDEVLLNRGWTGRDMVRTNAAMSCAKLGAAAAPAEAELLQALDDPCGHVGIFALDALRRIGSPQATRAALESLLAQRWDGSLGPDRQF